MMSDYGLIATHLLGDWRHIGRAIKGLSNRAAAFAHELHGIELQLERARSQVEHLERMRVEAVQRMAAALSDVVETHARKGPLPSQSRLGAAEVQRELVPDNRRRARRPG